MNTILSHLENNMQEIYRKAVDADSYINQLKKQGMAKFASVFPNQSLFNCSGSAFMPYVSELSEDIEQFKQTPNDESQLTLILKKMEQLHKVLAALKTITKSN